MRVARVAGFATRSGANGEMRGVTKSMRVVRAL
jgi:hypothetical protein